MEPLPSSNFIWAAATEIGGRAENQDHWECDIGRQQAIFIVADGLGGQMDGALAAKTVTRSALIAASELAGASAATVAKGASLAAAAQLSAMRQERGSDMASTIVVLALTANEAGWSWCGDSRLYLLHDGMLDRLTNDHSVSMAQVEKEERWHYDVRHDPGRSRLISVLGHDSPIIEEGSCSIIKGDVFFLCTDGFWEHLPRAEMLSLIRVENDPVRMLNSVLALGSANQDNLTLIRVETL